MKILIKEQISKNRVTTDEGYLVCLGAILARTGEQIYLESEVLENGDFNKEVKVYREPEEVFSENTIASFENKPVTIEHPNEFVNSENHQDLAVGFVRNVRKEVINSLEVLVGDLVITNSEAIKVIEQGKEFLSCGYDCQIVEQDGRLYQREIRGNHVAICDNPRAGITKIRDTHFINSMNASLEAVLKCLEKLNSGNVNDAKLELIRQMVRSIIKESGKE